MQPLTQRTIEIQVQEKTSKEALVAVIDKEAKTALDQQCGPGTQKNHSNSTMGPNEEPPSPRGPSREAGSKPETSHSGLHVILIPAGVLLSFPGGPCLNFTSTHIDRTKSSNQRLSTDKNNSSLFWVPSLLTRS